MAKLTPRMKNWLAGTGAHIGTATATGLPLVIVVDKALPEGDDIVRFPISNLQKWQIEANITENPQVSFGPGSIGSIRAAYQFKGKARLEDGELVVVVDEIYSTKPGPEAGLRLDSLPYESVVKFEESRWRDNGPPR
jgi:hypothetical protein